MDILNYETFGSERAQVPGIRSSIPFIVNEDWAMVGQITSPANSNNTGVIPYLWNGEGHPCIIKVRKVWDGADSNLDQFYAMLLYNGLTGYPSPTSVRSGQYVVLHRVGDFNSAGDGGSFELHKKNASAVSWVIFLNSLPSVIIRIVGTNSGISVIWQNDGWITIGEVKPISLTGSNFYKNPPYEIGDLFLGYDLGSRFLIELRGYTDLAKTITTQITQLSLSIDVDTAGRVLAIRAVEIL